ncbi:STEROL DESATURASE [Salix koriyanagi]|uniref:STEROL DESATURASE n=1 Tax=Salix koriyanagi TaxID=2511006 RepID=A0A9Q0Q8J1_9ROSI|nr:STEROL DESATURASE [Salix koriyanagi]
MLPYATLDEAAAALGRNLTVAETLWFNYSANNLWRSAGIDKYKIQPKVKLSPSEVFKCYKDVLFMFFFVVGPLQLVSYPSIKMIGIRTGLPLPSGWEIFLQLLVYFMVEDYTNYWIHRFLHNKWGYEKIHKVHHEYTAPIGFAAPYAHWAEILILGIPSFLGPAMVPGHMVTFWLWIALRQIEAIETHSGLKTCKSVCNRYMEMKSRATTRCHGFDFPQFIHLQTDYHDYHHYVGGQSHSNFASVFTYCDFIYGTDKGYRFQKKVLLKLKEGVENGGEQNGGSYHIATQDLKSD